MQDGVYRVHADVVFPIVRAHLERLAAAQWLLLANGTADSATQVLLADMCARATHKLCVHAAAALTAADSARERAAPTSVSVVGGGLASVLAAALDVASQPSVSAQKLDVVLQEEVRARVKATLAARSAPPLFVPTTFTETEVLAKMVLLTAGVLKVHLSKRDSHQEAPQSRNACTLEPSETAEAVRHILRKWTDPKQEVKAAAAEIVGIIVQDLHYLDSADGGRDSAAGPHFNLALIKEPLVSFFRCRTDPNRGAESLRQRNFLNFCRRKFEELTSELEQVRYQGTLVSRDQEPPTAHDSPLTFQRTRSRIEDIFKGAVTADDGSIDEDGLRAEAHKFSVELVDKMYRYVTTKRFPIQSPEAWRRASEPLALEVDQKKTENLHVLTMILEDSAKRFVQQLLLWLKMEPGTRQSHANELCGCLNDIQALVTRSAGAQSSAVCQEDALALKSPDPETTGDSCPLRKGSTGPGILGEKTEVRLQEDIDGPENLSSDVIGDSCSSEKVSAGSKNPQNEPELLSRENLGTNGPENPLPDTQSDSCPSAKVSNGTRSLENKPKKLSLDAVGDFSALEKDSTGATTPAVHLQEDFDLYRPDNPMRVVNDDACALEKSETGHPENKPEICLHEETTGESCSLGKMSTGTTSPQNKPEVCLQEDTNSPRSEIIGTEGNSDPVEKVSAETTSPENNLQEDANSPSSESPNTVADLENVPSGTKRPQEAVDEPDTKSGSNPLQKVSVRSTSPENANSSRSEHLAANAKGDSNPLERVSAITASPENNPGLFFPEDVDTARSGSPSPDTGGEAITLGTTSPEVIPGPKGASPPHSSSVCTRTAAHSAEPKSDSCRSLPWPPSPEDTATGVSPDIETEDGPLAQHKSARPKRPRPYMRGDACPSPPHLLSAQELTGTQDYIEDTPADNRCPPEVSASPFRPMCTVHEELLTLVDVIMVQLFAGLPDNVGRLVLSQDTVAAVHRVSKRMTGDALLLPWTKLGPCKLNRVVKEVIRGLKREFGSSQRLVDVFLFDSDKFDEVVLELLASGMDCLPPKQDDAQPGASAVGGFFFRAFCMRSKNREE